MRPQAREHVGAESPFLGECVKDVDTVGGAWKAKAAEDNYKGEVGDASMAIQEYRLRIWTHL
jgi:hypothetical protein